jgi:hypothetical protein
MKYPKPTDRYDCDVFCQNFHEIERRLLSEESDSDKFTQEIDILKKNSEAMGAALAGKIDGAYSDKNGFLYLTSDGDVVVGPLGPFAGSGGGTSANNAVIAVTNTTGWISTTISESDGCTVSFRWYSTEDGMSTGSGSVNVKVGGTSKLTKSIAQGDVSLDIREHLSVGSNVVKVTVSDVYGNERVLSFNILLVTFSLSSPFDDSGVYSGDIPFPYIPVGSAEKKIYFLLDGSEIGTTTITASGRQSNFTIPRQAHGAHSFEVYFTAEVNGTEVESNHLYYDIMFVEANNTTAIISSAFHANEIEQFYSVSIPYTVYSPKSAMSDITLSANGEVVQSLTVDRTRHIWTYRADGFGETILEIAVGDVKKQFRLNVTESDMDISAETNNLSLYLTSYGRSNAELNANEWKYGDVAASLENFNFVSDGWLSDADNNVVLRVAGNARVNIPLNIFDSDFRQTGKTIEFEFATRDVMNYDAEIMSCMTGGKGITFTAQKVTFKSEQSELFVQYKENEHIRVSFVVEKSSDNRLIYVYVDGIISGVIQYPDTDDFQQSTPVGISIGSNDCTVDLYNIRVYDNNLTRHQVLENWIADTQNGQERLERFARNNIYDAYGQVVKEKLPSDLRYMMLVASALPNYKGDKKRISGYYEDPMDSSKSFVFDIAVFDVQGTSSQYYKRKNFKGKFEEGFIVGGETVDVYQMREDSIGVNTFTFKADVASSEGANNVELVRLYNDICPYKTPAQLENENVRQGIDGFPIVMFWDNGEETTFLGKYNFNNDKATEEVFGFRRGDESWEIKNNTSNRSLFKSADFTGTDWLNDFEGRYPDGNTNAAKLSALSKWLVSTDQTQATGAALESPVVFEDVVYQNDTAAYRLAKFKAEAENWLELDSWIFNYVFTELFLMVDSRAKNAFPTYYMGGKWCVLPYDFDTAIGINNEGLLVFNYNLEDTDKVNGSNVYNGQDSVLYINLREAFAKEIETMYQQLRSGGQLSYEEVERRFEEHQALWSEAIFNEDAYYKYIEPLISDGEATYLSMCQGSKESQRKWWLYNRFRYIDSKYSTGDALNHIITLRAYQKSDFEITPYADIYPCVAFDSTRVKRRGVRNEKCEIKSPETWDPNGSDAVVSVYSANELKDVGDLAPFKVGYADFAKAVKLQRIKVGDKSADYSNGNLTELYVGNNTLLKTVDVRNCPNLIMSVDLSGCTNLEEAYFEGTAVTAVQLPNGGILRTLHLPNTVTNLTLRNQTLLTDFKLDDYSNITTLRLENTDVVDSREILEAIAPGSRVRIVGFDWAFEDGELDSFVNILETMRGLDENGNNANTAQLVGTIRIGTITIKSLRKLQENYPDITVMYENVMARISSFLDGTIAGTYTNDTTETLDRFAFYQCKNLEKVKFTKVTDVGSECFGGCVKLHTADFNKATRISLYWDNSSAFSGCISLTSLILRNTEQICELQGTSVFYKTPIANGTGYIYVPKALIEDYKSATNWSTFAEQFRAIEDYPDICGGE